MAFEPKVFYKEVKEELTKVTWPERNATIATTGVVMVVVALITLYLGLADAVLSRLSMAILG